jgi:hypothetical protein
MYIRLTTIAILAAVVTAISASPAAAERSCGTERVQPGRTSPATPGSTSGPGLPYKIIVWRGSVSCAKARSLIKETGEGKGKWHEAAALSGIYTSFPGGWSCALASGGGYGCVQGRRIRVHESGITRWGRANEIDGLQL